MAALSPTPLPSHAMNNDLVPSGRMFTRRSSPAYRPMENPSSFRPTNSDQANVGDSSDDDDPAPPIQLNPLTRALLEKQLSESPKKIVRQTILKIERSSPASSSSPKNDSITPAPSLRIKRVGVQGAPVRRNKRTPQGDDDAPPSQDQENLPASVMKHKHSVKLSVRRDERPIPLASMSANTPHRANSTHHDPPPKMPAIESVTNISQHVTKSKRRRNHFIVNGRTFAQLSKLGKGGSSDVYRVVGENGKNFALKRVKLDEADEAAIAGFKGEIELLRRLQNVDRVVRLFDWQVDEEKQMLSVLMEPGDTDLSKILRAKFEPPQSDKFDDYQGARLDICFVRFYWKEMLECVAAIHDHDIVHSDLKPANFVLVCGQLKLIDFGIANAIDIENTVNVHRDSHVGTPNYMSPESIEDSNSGLKNANGGCYAKLMKLGKPSDVWSLGCILYQMVYGKPPFGHIANPIHRVMAIMNPSIEIEYPPLGIGNVTVPLCLTRTMRSCLNRTPSERPTALDLLSETNHFLYPDSHPDLRISQDLLAQIIQRVVERVRDTKKDPPSDEDIRQYPVVFYERIREWQEKI